MSPARLAYTGVMPVTHYMALMLALLVLALAGVVLAGHRRREREQREHLRAMREREEKLRLSLWASNELYWQYDLDRHELEKVQIEDLELRNLTGSITIGRTPQGLVAQGKFSAETTLECVRCLKEFTQEVTWEFTELYAFKKKSVSESTRNENHAIRSGSAPSR